MKKFHPPVFNTAHATYRRRWPLKADYLDISRPTALSLVDDFVTVFGFEPLLARNQFRQLVPLRTRSLDPYDLKEALQISIDVVSATNRDDGPVRDLRERLEGQFGPLHGLIAVRLSGWPFVIMPKAAML